MAFGDFTVDRNDKKYVLGSGGTIIEYAEDEPAFEFNADGSYKGLLVEPAATNLAIQSEDLSTDWTQTNVTVATDATTAPDGNTTADELRANTTSQTYAVQQGFTSTSANHTFSVFAKKDELNYIQLSFANTVNQYANFDLDLGVVGTKGTAANSSTIEDYGNGWYRCSVHINVGTIPSFGIAIVSSASATWRQNVSAGSATEGVFLWGAQLETSPIATSYMPTTGSPFTRGKDEASMTNVSGLIGQKEGTLYVEVDFRRATGTNQHLLSASNGTVANVILIYVIGGNTLMYIQAGGGVVLNTGASDLSDGIQKLAFAYANGDQEFYRNGSSIATTTGSLAALATLTDIDLGQDYAANVQANMHIRAVQIIPRRLSDAQLIELTS